ncbi:dihydrolipoamide acetyltransferase family protein [Pontibacter sp. JAM-7]|uniref:dihydrolipoamide acetyltransferase family protein n=1 Tax=Pontibacter sp. JAM-7 TaxID=3366581 RepID=UPI003AF826F0
MKYFKLPDLGEGLTEAEIVSWHIQAGDQVKVDQPLLTVETAKAMIDLPAPQAGQISHLFGQPGDLVHIGEPLLEYQNESDNSQSVVGEIPSTSHANKTQGFIIGAATGARNNAIRTTPAVRALAHRLGLDLHTLHGSGPKGQITPSDVEQAAKLEHIHGPAVPLRGPRRHMAKNLQQSHAEVVPVTLTEQVCIQNWSSKANITLRLIRAIAHALGQVPEMHRWFDGNQLALRQHEKIDLGVAVDTEQGLFVPVLRDIANRSDADLTAGLQQLRQDVAARAIPAAELQGATFTLSNFGMLGGLFATPVVIPPQVGILAAGRVFDFPVQTRQAIQLFPHLPLSLTFDHRALTGAEAARFLASVATHLSQLSAK